MNGLAARGDAACMRLLLLLLLLALRCSCSHHQRLRLPRIRSELWCSAASRQRASGAMWGRLPWRRRRRRQSHHWHQHPSSRSHLRLRCCSRAGLWCSSCLSRRPHANLGNVGVQPLLLQARREAGFRPFQQHLRGKVSDCAATARGCRLRLPARLHRASAVSALLRHGASQALPWRASQQVPSPCRPCNAMVLRRHGSMRRACSADRRHRKPSVAATTVRQLQRRLQAPAGLAAAGRLVLLRRCQ